MPRRLLRDRVIVEDDWLYAAEWTAAGWPPRGWPPRVILSWDQWRAERDAWIAHAVGLGGAREGAAREGAASLGVVLSPEHPVEQLAADLQHLSLVACSFPGPSEGRGYSQGRLLRERYDFQGELRATGYVRIDQLFFLARCGFNSFELADHDLAGAGATAAAAAFATFTAAYQPANDRGLPRSLSKPGKPASV
jgi:uncharacterized protein (DUF934 family)